MWLQNADSGHSLEIDKYPKHCYDSSGNGSHCLHDVDRCGSILWSGRGRHAPTGTARGVSWPSLPAPGTRGRFLAGHSLNIIPTSPNSAQADSQTHLTKPGLDLAPSLNKPGKGSCGGG